LDYLVFFGFLATAVLIEIVSCGFPSITYFLDIGKELTVGVGMIAWGEAGLLVAGTGYAMDATPTEDLPYSSNHLSGHNDCKSFSAKTRENSYAQTAGRKDFID